jgi:branched-chain amino acid transport system substrate-binding protein
MKNIHLKAALAAGSAALLLLSACGSSDSDKPGLTAPTGPKLTGDPIVVGTICGCTGPQAASLSLVRDAADAWAQSVNNSGGINGHPVKMIVKDSASNPATALQAAKELVEQDKVIAIVGEVDLVDDSWAEYVESKGVPVVGGLSVDAAMSTNPDFFASGAAIATLQFGMINEAMKAGNKHAGVLYCAEAPVCAQIEGLTTLVASVAGDIDMAAATKIAATSPTFTSQCLAMKSADVDAVNIVTNAEVVLRVAQACAKLGYEPQLIAQANTISTTWLKDPAMDGTIIVGANANYLDDSIPAVKEFLDAMDTYYPEDRDKAEFGYSLINAWVGGKLFEAAAKAANIGPDSTPEDVKKGLYALKDETLGGLVPPLNFVKDKPAPPTCYFVMKIEDSKFKSVGTDPVCMNDEQTAALFKGLAG